MEKAHYTFIAQSTDWSHIIGRMLHGKDVSVANVEMSANPMGHITFTVSKDLVTPEEVSAALGMSLEAVTTKSKFTLLPLYDPANWAKPTVNYTGEA